MSGQIKNSNFLIKGDAWIQLLNRSIESERGENLSVGGKSFTDSKRHEKLKKIFALLQAMEKFWLPMLEMRQLEIHWPKEEAKSWNPQGFM